MSVLTISRQFGAGGRTLGKIIARKLNYTFVDNEIIQMVAEKAKISTDWVESMEREAGGKLQRMLSGMVRRSFIERLLENKWGYIDEAIYVDLLQKIITQIAQEDNVVILGRGGQYILRDQPNVFHLLLVGDTDYRISFMEKHYNLSHAQAVQAVNAEDRRRFNLYRKFGREDYDRPGLYHMVLNMSKLELEKAADMVCCLIHS